MLEEEEEANKDDDYTRCVDSQFDKELFAERYEQELTVDVVECDTIHNIEEILISCIDTNNVEEIIEEIYEIANAASLISQRELFDYKFDVSEIIYALLSVDESNLKTHTDTVALFSKLLGIIKITEKSSELLLRIFNHYEEYLEINELILLSMKLVEIEYPIPFDIMNTIYQYCLHIEDFDIFCDMIYILSWCIQENSNICDDYIDIKVIYNRCIIFLQQVSTKAEDSSIDTDFENIEAVLDFLIVVVKIIDENFTTLLELLFHMVGDYPELLLSSIKVKSLEVFNNICATRNCDILECVEGFTNFFDHFIENINEDVLDLLCPIMIMLNMYDNHSYKAMISKLLNAITENCCNIEEYPKIQMFINLFSE